MATCTYWWLNIRSIFAEENLILKVTLTLGGYKSRTTDIKRKLLYSQDNLIGFILYLWVYL